MRKKALHQGMLIGLLMIVLQPAGLTGIYSQQTDTIKGTDTIRARVIRDSTELRLQFVRDSIIAREQFISDSIQNRQRVLDSLSYLQRELPVLLEAWYRTIKEDIILRSGKIPVVGDSALGNYEYMILPFSVSEPFIPWKASVALTNKTYRYGIDKKNGKISSIQGSFMKCSFVYGTGSNVLVISEASFVQKHWSGNYYKTPVDSVFYDRNKRITKIKRYVQFYELVNNNQRGTALFLNPAQVIQYEYGADNQLTQYQVVRFCDRWKVYDPVKVCSIITYSLSKQDGKYMLTRRNDPPNIYSDGTFVYEFDGNENLKNLSFRNLSNTENWERSVDMNINGFVNCYTDKKDGIVLQSTCYIYHDKDPGAKYPVEIITTTFEKDGISYFQQNNTTGKSRSRDRMTLEWSIWR